MVLQTKLNLSLLRHLWILGGHTAYSVTQSCLTLCNPMDCSLPGASLQWIFQARRMKWVFFCYPRKIFTPQGSNLGLLHWQDDSLSLSHMGSCRGHLRGTDNSTWRPNLPSSHSYLLLWGTLHLAHKFLCQNHSRWPIPGHLLMHLSIL